MLHIIVYFLYPAEITSSSEAVTSVTGTAITSDSNQSENVSNNTSGVSFGPPTQTSKINLVIATLSVALGLMLFAIP